MNPEQEAPASGAGDRIVGWWRRRGLVVLTITALVLAAAAGGMRLIALADTDLPPLDQFARDTQELYLPWLRGEWNAWTSVWHDHDAGRRAWDLAWLSWNGQVNAQVLALAGLVAAMLAIVALFGTLARHLRAGSLALLAAAVAAMFATPAFIELRPVAGPAWSGCLIALSLLHLALMHAGDSWRWQHVAGLACGTLNIAAATEGLASAVALVIWHSIAALSDRSNWRIRRRTLLANVALVAAGIVLLVGRADSGGEIHLVEVLNRMAWPLSNAAWIPVVWAPVAVCFALSVRIGIHRSELRGPSLVGLWALLIALGASLLGDPTPPLVVATGIAVNAACLAAFATSAGRSGVRSIAATALWCIVVGSALLHPHSFRNAVGLFPPEEGPVTPALQQAIRQNDASALRDELGWSEAKVDEFQRLLAQPGLRSILPPSIRPPLDMTPGSGDEGDAFRADAAPTIPGRASVPAIGTWYPDERAVRGVFVSRPLETTFPLLQFRVIGELREPATSLFLRGARGGESRALDGPFTSTSRWRRIHIPATQETLQVIARDASDTAWLAFTSPLEIGRLSWLSAKVPRGWSWVLAGSIAAAVATVAWLARDCLGRSFDAEAPVFAWRLAPWLALVAYAAYFSHHIDTTAGPNDSGGYLNSAKLLASGHVTGVPHAPLEPITDAAGLDPYLPVVFRSTADARMAPQYPVGFPMLIAALTPVMSLDRAVASILFVHLIAGIVLVRMLARSFGLPDGWSWLAAGLVGLSPEYFFHGLQPMSDTIALVWVTAAIHLAWTGRDRPWQAVAAGLATSIAVLIRPSNLLCAVPLVFCFAGSWRAMASWILGGIPGAVWQFWYNLELYGSGLRTGYGAMDTMLGVQFFAPNAGYYALWMMIPFTPVVGLAFVAPFLRSIDARARMVLITWAAVFPAFYAFYWCNGMRFLLPAAPAVLVLALLAARQILTRLDIDLFPPQPRRRQVLATAVVLTLMFGFQIADGFRQRSLYWLHANREHAVVSTWVREHVPADAVVIARVATGSLMYYTDLTFVRAEFDREPCLPPTLVEKIVRSGRPVYAVLYGEEGRRMVPSGPESRDSGWTGSWEHVTTLWNDGVSVWKWRGRAD